MGEKHVVKLGLHMVEDGEKVQTEFLMIVLKNKTEKRGIKTNQRLFCVYISYNIMHYKRKKDTKAESFYDDN